MTEKFMNEIIASYDPEDEKFGNKVNKMIDNYFANLPKSTSKIDPERLNSKAVMISRLRGSLLAKAGSVVLGTPESKEFDELTPKEQLVFQLQSIRLGTPKWVLDVEIMPDNINSIRMSEKDDINLKALRNKVDKDKLQAPMENVDADSLMTKLLPYLTKENPKWEELTCALLFVTGRRSIEILKTAEFYLSEGQEFNGYTCVFKGQAKKSIFASETYNIPVLAKFSVVSAALAKLRSMRDNSNLTERQVNSVYSKQLNNVTNRLTKLNPHELRAVYAMCVYELADKDKKMSKIGFIG